MESDVLRCKVCVLPSTYPGIRFNADGICNFCMDFKNEPLPADALKHKLDRIVEHQRGKGKYDAVVGISGGKDSTYVAYYLKKEFNLKMLGINFDNGYRSEYAVHNINALVDTLGIDLITLRPSRIFLNKLFRHFLITNGEFCSVCNNLGYLLIGSYCMNQQRLYGQAPLIVGGWSKKYEFQPGVSVTSMQYFFSHLSADLLEELFLQPFIEEQAVRIFMRMNDPRQPDEQAGAQKDFAKHIGAFIQLPDYIPWDLRNMPHLLGREVGWRQPPDVHGSHFDCSVFPIKEYLKFRKFGLTQETIKNSVMIREGLMTRADAIQRMSFDQTTEPSMYTEFLSSLELTANDVREDGEWSR